MLDFGGYVALFSELKALLERVIARNDNRELLEIRAALKELYFGKSTLTALDEAQGGELSKATIAFSDSAKPVRDALDRLRQLATEEGCSIHLRELITHVGYEKITIRESVALGLQFADNRTPEKYAELQAQIRGLNRAIEELDLLLGGLRI
jgi:hypothetical protein